MNKPQRIRELSKLNKTECGIYYRNQEPKTACLSWIRAENGDYDETVNSYFDLLLMILEAVDRKEQWAIELIAKFLVRGKA